MRAKYCAKYRTKHDANDYIFFIGILLWIIAIVALVIRIAASPGYEKIQGTVEKIEVISIEKSFWGDTYYKRVKFKSKEPIILFGDREKTRIEEGKFYRIVYMVEHYRFGHIKEIELIE